MFHLLSRLEVLLQGVGEALGVLDEVPLAVLQALLALRARYELGHSAHRIQQLLDARGDLPASI